MSDEVNHPSHYTAGKVEVIEIVEQIVNTYSRSDDAWCIGQVIKYLARAPLKGNYLTDLKKAKWYLDRAVERGTDKKDVLAGGPSLDISGLYRSLNRTVSDFPPYGNLGDD